MKTIYTTLVAIIIVGMVGCQKDSDLMAELSAEDVIANEGMEKAEAEAKLYNDSLIWCTDTSNHCTTMTTVYYDSLYHVNDDLYEMHHNNYSHNNLEDDHHHSAVSEHNHGNMMHEGNEGGAHGHSQASHQEMTDLRKNHEAYHIN